MAKTKDKDAAEEGLPIDAESALVLEDQVKKGKARKFILIYKGSDIKKLIVFKKGPFSVLIQKARKEGFRGEAVCGIVTGSGINLNFQLAGNKEVADAMSVEGIVDEEPTKIMKLKEFLADNDLKRKPAYDIVRDVKQLAKPEDDQEEASSNGAAAPIEGDPVAATDTPGDEPPFGDLEGKCKQLQSAIAPKIKEAVAAVPDKKNEITALLQTAINLQKGGSWAEAFEALKQLVTMVKETLALTPPAAPPSAVSAPSSPSAPSVAAVPAKSPEEEAYEKELKAVQQHVDDLNKHVHKAHIAGELASIGTELTTADTEFKAKKYTDAMKTLKKAKDLAGKAKEYADKYEAYAKKRAEAQFLTNAFKDLLKLGPDASGNPSYLDDRITAITDADNLASPPTRNYAGATTKIEGVVNDLKGVITKWYVTPNEPKIQTLKTGSTKVFLADQITAIEGEMNVLKANITAKDYRKALLHGPIINKMIAAATAVASRRTSFDTQRVKTVTAIDGIKKFPSLSTQMEDLNKRLKEADDQASLETRQFENATEAVTKLESDAKALTKNGAGAEAYVKDRKPVDKAYEDLSKHKQASAQKALLDGIKTKLDKAAELAKDPAKVAEANAELKLAKQEIDAAKKVLTEVDALGVVAGNASDAATAKKSLDALKISLAAVKKHKHAGAFASEFKAIDDQVTSAEKNLKEKKDQEAIHEIKHISDALSSLMVQLTQQGGYASDRASLDDRLKKIKALPEAATIQANITPVETALKDADTQDKAHAFDKRATAMEKAREAAALAEKTALDSRTYDARRKKLETNVSGSSLVAADQKKVTDLIKPASEKATELKYDEATKLLVQAEAEYESLLISSFAKQATPDLAKIEAAAKRMMKSGSAKEIDKLIQRLPNATKHDVLKTLAKERFGIDLKTDAGSETVSAKAMLNMLAKVPEDVLGNVSLKTVERREPGKDGGFYRASEQLVVMNGRPGQATQGFGATIASELPADVDPNCQPDDDTTVDYFDFATLHELGHSVDDNLQFMASREGKADFGNWKSYGGAIGPIVDVVADWTGYNSTPEQKKAISDLIQGNQVTWPTAPSGKEAEWDTAKQKVIDWHSLANVSHKIWWKQSDIDKVAINGTVYHEAYARQWVSYDAGARKKGITGYQFRAPGEWFAELYASYRMDKLKAAHPAVAWLSKLKV